MTDDLKKRILNVDDNDAGRYATTRTLRKAGFEVMEASTGNEALRMAEELPDMPDLILLDVNLPDIIGFEVCRRIKLHERTCGIPIVHTSATFVGVEERAEGLNQGADGYLTHPVDPKVLVATINSVLRLTAVEQKLRESEARFLMTIQNSQVNLSTQDLELRYTWISNPQLGYSAADVVGKTDADLLPEETARRVTDLKHRVLATGTALREENSVRMDGQLIWFDMLIEPRHDTRGRLIGVTNVVVDITERKRNEEVVRRSEERFRTSVESFTDGFAIFSAVRDASGKIVDFRYEYINEAGTRLRLNRRPIIDDVGRTILESTPEFRESALFAEYIRIIEEGGTIETDALTFKDVYGSDNPESPVFEFRATKLGDGLVVVWRDVTERKRSEQALRESEERYRMLVESSPDGVILHRDGTFLYANSAALELYGADSLEQLRTKTVLDLIHEDDRDLIRARMQLGQPGDHLPIFETRMLTLDGRVIPVESVGARINYQGGTANQILSRDITGRKKRESELSRLNRTYRALSCSSQALMRAVSERQYMKDVCSIVVEECKYSMVWIGVTGDDPEKLVHPVVYSGFEEGYLETLKVTWADTERGRGPTGTAVRTGEPVVCRNMVNDPKFLPWREAALKRGYASSIGLPLKLQGQIFGALTIYSREKDGFPDNEVKLLAEIADDLSYGITAIRLRAAHDHSVETLKLMEERYHNLFNGMTEGFALHEIILDHNGQPYDYRYLDANQSFERLTGLKRDDIIGRTKREVLPDGDLIAIQTYGEVVMGGNSVNFEYYSPALERHYSVLAYRPAPMQFAVIFTDITLHKRMEEVIRRSRDMLEHKVIERTAELTKSEERFRNTLDNLLEGCMIVDCAWTYLYVNDAIAAHTGRAKKNLIGFRLWDVDPAIRTSAAFECYRVCMEHRIPQEFIDEVPGPDGTAKWFHLHCVPVPEGIFVMSSDITARKRAELALRQYNEQLQGLSLRLIEAQEAERRAIAFELHDEIGQVLTAIQLNLHGIVEFEDPKDFPARLEETITLTERLLQQVREFSVDLRPWMLDQLGLAPSVRWYLDKQAQRGKFAMEFSAENIGGRFLPVIEITSYRVIQESITNIIRHARATEVTVTLTAADGRLCAEIRDNGVGFDPEKLEEKPIDRRGLGMLGMRERVASLGGSLDITSVPGEGTTIRFSLPLREIRTRPLS